MLDKLEVSPCNKLIGAGDEVKMSDLTDVPAQYKFVKGKCSQEQPGFFWHIRRVWDDRPMCKQWNFDEAESTQGPVRNYLCSRCVKRVAEFSLAVDVIEEPEVEEAMQPLGDANTCEKHRIYYYGTECPKCKDEEHRQQIVEVEAERDKIQDDAHKEFLRRQLFEALADEGKEVIETLLSNFGLGEECQGFADAKVWLSNYKRAKED